MGEYYWCFSSTCIKNGKEYSPPGHINPLLRAGPSSRYTITRAMSGVPGVMPQSLTTSHFDGEKTQKTSSGFDDLEEDGN
jgi:hypothetical protein